jgi:hypothetical protein
VVSPHTQLGITTRFNAAGPGGDDVLLVEERDDGVGVVPGDRLVGGSARGLDRIKILAINEPTTAFSL